MKTDRLQTFTKNKILKYLFKLLYPTFPLPDPFLTTQQTVPKVNTGLTSP